MTRALLALLLVPLVGCASTTDRVVSVALKTPAVQAEYLPATGSSALPALMRLEARLAALGISVEYADLPDGLSGQALGHAIVIDARLEPNARLEVLAHEAGHLFQPESFSRVEAQAFAELVGADVCARLGFPMHRTSGRYLAAFKNGLAAAVAAKVDRERAVRILLGEQEP